MNTVIFVTDSSLDEFNTRALVGTSYYRVFLEYLNSMDLSVNDVLLYNDKDYQTIKAIAEGDSGVRVITLGADAEAAMSSQSVPFFPLPPLSSTAPRQSFNFLQVIEDCKGYVSDNQIN